MDALREAETAKLQGSGLGLNLESFIPSVSPIALPDLNACLDKVNVDLQAAAPPYQRPLPPEGKPSAAQDAEGNAAAGALGDNKPLFPSGTATAPAPTRKSIWVGLLAGTALALMGIAGYFWQELQGAAKSDLDRPSQAMFRPLATPPFPAVVGTSPEPSQATTVPGTLPQASPPPAEIREPYPEARSRQANESPPSPIRLTRSSASLNPVLERAYTALQHQDFASAHQDYEQVLQTDPKNVDALLGLAAIAGREGQTKQAEMLYLQALEADPKNPAAQADLIGTRGLASPLQSEATLKTILAEQPEAGHVHFTLGNLYAQQGRWSEAQAAYFKALASDGDNPDYLFNLAVSLDHLHQNKAAAQYYRHAITATDSRSAAFDPEQGRRRLQELQP